MNEFSKNLVESMGEACAHAEGNGNAVRIRVVEVPDVRAIRRKLCMSQTEFAEKISDSAADGKKLGAGPEPTGRASVCLSSRSRATADTAPTLKPKLV